MMCVPGGESAVSRNDGCAGSWSSLVCRREEDLWRANASGAGRRGSARRRVVRVVRLLIALVVVVVMVVRMVRRDGLAGLGLGWVCRVSSCVAGDGKCAPPRGIPLSQRRPTDHSMDSRQGHIIKPSISRPSSFPPTHHHHHHQEEDDLTAITVLPNKTPMANTTYRCPPSDEPPCILARIYDRD